jgi:hypothetical protein
VAWYRVLAKICRQQAVGLNHQDAKMTNFIIGFVFGIVVATVGFTGVARVLDHGVQTIQNQSKELVH